MRGCCRGEQGKCGRQEKGTVCGELHIDGSFWSLMFDVEGAPSWEMSDQPLLGGGR